MPLQLIVFVDCSGPSEAMAEHPVRAVWVCAAHGDGLAHRWSLKLPGTVALNRVITPLAAWVWQGVHQ